jgi:hypothetical protein
MLVRALALTLTLAIAGCAQQVYPIIPSVPYMPPYYLAPPSYYHVPVNPECLGPMRELLLAACVALLSICAAAETTDR